MTLSLAAALAADDAAEDAGMHPDDRTTCHQHQDWAENCASKHSRPSAEQMLAHTVRWGN
ncbi:hypothetical protein ACFV4P_35410 [Kitasatospora sp. NPDC059795]|uniref:hypothetical protein n=1 Tax=Kitasatospora sp. NPDC059795 TaxID=3346949 RepID=UPI003649365A